MLTIGQAMRKARKNKRIPQVKLSELTGIRQSLLSLYEHDKITPSIITVISIAEALKITLDDLVGRSIPGDSREKM